MKHLAYDRGPHIVNLLLHQLHDEVFAQLVREPIVVQSPQHFGVVLANHVSVISDAIFSRIVLTKAPICCGAVLLFVLLPWSVALSAMNTSIGAGACDTSLTFVDRTDNLLFLGARFVLATGLSSSSSSSSSLRARF